MTGNVNGKRNYRLIAAFLLLSLSLNLTGAAIPAAAAPSHAVFEQGCTQMMRKNFREAIALFTEVISDDSTDANAYFRRGQCFYCVQDIKNALNDFDRAISLADGNYQCFLWRGSAQAKLGDDDKAIEDYEKAMHLNPALIEAFKNQNNQGASYEQTIPTATKDDAKGNTISLGSNPSALKDYTEAIRRATVRVSGYFSPGTVYSGIILIAADSGERQFLFTASKNKGEVVPKDGADFFSLSSPKRDIDECQRRIDDLPETSLNFFERARAYQQLKDRSHALMDFNRAVELNPDNVMYILARAFFYHQLGENDLATEDIKKAQSLDPSVPSALSFERTQRTAEKTAN